MGLRRTFAVLHPPQPRNEDRQAAGERGQVRQLQLNKKLEELEFQFRVNA